MSKDYGFEIQSFAPDEDLTDDVSIMYMDMLDNLMKNKQVRNIAMTGDLGIGKSTLIRNYERKYENTVLDIFPNNENIRKIVMAEALNEPIKTVNTDDVKIEKNENTKIKKILNKILKLYNKYKLKFIIFLSKRLPKKKYVYLSVTDMKINPYQRKLKEELESRLLKQLLVICNKEEMIGSYYRPVPEKKIGLIPAILTIILSLLAVKWFECLPEIKDNIFIWIVFSLFCLFSIYYLMKKLCLHYKLPNFEFNFGGEKNNGNAKAEHTEAEETLDKNMNDIVYLMERIYKKSAKVLVVEDLDRYGADICIPIIEKLREINVLVNQRIRFLHGDSKPFRFVYILKDDIFSEMQSDKTNSSVPPSKYFDGILPVVPQLGHANSADYLIGKREWNTKYNINEDFIYEVSKYILDYRQIRAIENEFNVFREVAKDKIKDNSKFNATELMAFCIYKHFYPEEYYKIRTQPEQELISYVFEKEIHDITTDASEYFIKNTITPNEVKLPTDDKKKTLFDKITINILRYIFPDNSINDILGGFNTLAKNITLYNVEQIKKQLHKSSAYYIDFRLILAIYAVICTSEDSDETEEVLKFQKTLMDECDENIKNASGDNAKEKFAFYYAMALVDSTAEMTDTEEFEDIAEKIKTKILDKYQTSKIAEAYAKALFNVTVKMTDAKKIEDIAEKIKTEILDKYQTPEIALQYTKALANATSEMTDSDERIRLADKIKTEILDEYNTPEIAEAYAGALFNATAKLTDSDEIQKKADIIKELLDKYQTPKIAHQYAMALVRATDAIKSAEICETIADNFKNEYLSQKKYQTEEIYEQYVIIINNIAESMETSDEILEITDRYYSEILINGTYRIDKIEIVYVHILNLAAKKIPDGINASEIQERIKYPELKEKFERLLNELNDKEILDAKYNINFTM